MNHKLLRMIEEAGFQFTPDVMAKLPEFEKLVKLTYEWQGLTDDEIGAMEKEYLFGGKEFDDEIGYWAVYRAIEAKLKEKNAPNL